MGAIAVSPAVQAAYIEKLDAASLRCKGRVAPYSHTLPVPLHSPSQALAEIHRRLIAQQFPCQPDVCERIANIAGSRRFVKRLAAESCQFLQNRESVVE